MEDEFSDIYGDLVVSEVVTISGTVTGSITVQNGGCLTLYGKCSGNLIVETGTVASMLGIVVGDVVNHGGQVSVSGLVSSSLICREGRTEVDLNTRVLGNISGEVFLTCENCSQLFSVIIQGRESRLNCPKCGLLWMWLPAEVEKNKRSKSEFSTKYFLPKGGGMSMILSDSYISEMVSSEMGLDRQAMKVDVNNSQQNHSSSRISFYKRILRKLEFYVGLIGAIALIFGIFIYLVNTSKTYLLGGLILCSFSTFIKFLNQYVDPKSYKHD
jgi:cytoskeletal protein CcmA (bactofilin family)